MTNYIVTLRTGSEILRTSSLATARSIAETVSGSVYQTIDGKFNRLFVY